MPAITQISPEGVDTAYDSVWAVSEAAQHSSYLEQIMLSHDKIYVVLAVVLIIWIGLMILVVRTDKKLVLLEREMDDRIGSSTSETPSES